MPHRAAPLLALFLALSLVACGPAGPRTSVTVAASSSVTLDDMATAASDPDDPAEAPERDGLRLTLRSAEPADGGDGERPDGDRDDPADPAGAALPDAARAALLARTPGLRPQPSDAAVQLPAALEPPPDPDAEQAAFPPADELPPPPGRGPDAPPPEPLRVLRLAPTGEHDVVPQLVLDFSQPMVPLASLGAVEAAELPVTLSPRPAGRWRWVDPRVLVFEPEGRFPGATHFRVEVPAGTTSATGGTLAEPVSAVLSTPPPGLADRVPDRGGLLAPDAVIALAFDQRMDPRVVLEHAQLAERGAQRSWNLRVVEPAELPEGDPARQLLERSPAGHVVLLAPRGALPLGVDLRLELRAGLPSAEGPRRREQPLALDLHTPGPLFLKPGFLELSPVDGRPLEFWLHAPHELDPACAEQVELRSVPAVDDLAVSVERGGLRVAGAFAAGTTYTLTVGTGLRDVYGQQLASPSEHTLRVKSFDARVALPGGDVLVLDPFEPAALEFVTRNWAQLDARLLAVSPERFAEFAERPRSSPWGKSSDWDPATLGDPLHSTTHRLQSAPESTPRRSLLALAEAFPDDRGHALLGLRFRGALDENRRDHMNWTWRWLQRTRLAADVLADDSELAVWVTDLRDGRPVEGARVSLLGTPRGDASDARTDASGLAVLPIPYTPDADRRTPGARAVLVEHAGDSVIRPALGWNWGRHGGGWKRQQHGDGEQVLWHTLDDRGLYRPGETVSLTGWVRRFEPAEGGDTTALPEPRALAVKWTAVSPRNQEFAAGTAPVDAFGNFALAAELPAEVDLGELRVDLELLRGDATLDRGRHTTQVAEFRRPEYEVTVLLPEARAVVGEELPLLARADYFAGGAVRDAPLTWTIRDSSASWRPEGWDGWTFGGWEPWWSSWSRGGGSGHYAGFRGDRGHGEPLAELAARTDAAGEHRAVLALRDVHPARPRRLTAEAVVTDADAQQWAARASTLVHPASLAVGLRARRGFVRAGEPFPLEHVVTDLDGAVVADAPVTLRLFRKEWVRDEEGNWSEQERDVQELALRSGPEPGLRELRVNRAGSWTVQAVVSDAADRRSESELGFWVAGPAAVQGPAGVEAAELLLIPDRAEYAAGDTAELLVVAPFERGHLEVSLGRSGRLGTQVLAFEGGSAVLAVELTDAHLPALHVEVGAAGQQPREARDGSPRANAPPRPAYALGQARLPVSLDGRRLAVEVTPAAELVAPGAETQLEVCVRDPEGRPLPEAGVALVVVDESVHVAGGYELRDPLPAFHPDRPSGIEATWLRDLVTLVELDDALRGALRDARGYPLVPHRDPGEVEDSVQPEWIDDDVFQYDALEWFGYLGDGGGEGVASMAARSFSVADAPAAKSAGADPTIGVRSDLSPLAAFRTDLRTDAEGCLRASVRLPERLTRWRVMVVATDGGARFGTGEASLRTSKPLRLRASFPRLLRTGDRAELPVVLHNDGDAPAEVQLAVEASLLELQPLAAGRTLTLPARDRVELRLPVHAPRSGTARLLLVLSDVADPSRNDALSLPLRVERPTTLERFALYGSLADASAARVPVQLPADARPAVGALQVSAASTAFASLTDAFVDLVTYPYECAEQRASRQLALTALHDVLAAFDAPGLPAPEQRRAVESADMAALAECQDEQGAFHFWPGRFDHAHRERTLYLTVHVTHALVRADRAERGVPTEMLERALKYLAGNFRGHVRAALSEERISQSTALVLRAYAVHVLRLAGQDGLDGEALDVLAVRPAREQPLEVLGWLLPLLADDPALADRADELLTVIDERAVQTAAEARFATHYTTTERAALLHGDRRTDGVLLEALLEVAPDHHLVEKVVRGLLAHRRRGAWGSTQENVFVLLGLQAAFRALEANEPRFTARAWLGDTGLLVERFEGRETRSVELALPMAQLASLLAGGRGAPPEPAADPEAAAAAQHAAAAGAGAPLTLQKQGDGRLWWRVGLEYAPGGEQLLAPREQGFSVRRAFEAVDDPADVSRRDDGTWVIRRGATVRVKLELLAPSLRHHVALVDPLPAGLEALDPDLPVSATVQPDGNAPRLPWWCWWRWYEHENLRDERVEVFGAAVPAGVHHYSYLARATTPGDFVLPPLHVEEMYTPETFARGAEGRVIVE